MVCGGWYLRKNFPLFRSYEGKNKGKDFQFGFSSETGLCKKSLIGVSSGFWYFDLCLFRDALKRLFADCADAASFYSDFPSTGIPGSESSSAANSRTANFLK